MFTGGEKRMKLILRADDLGFSDGINCGIRKSVKDGMISCVGMMPNMEEAEHGFHMIKDDCTCIGQHTNICVGKPLSDPALIPSLVQENGEFCTSKEIRERQEDTIVLEEAELEIEAQLQRFIEITGKKPDYFEGHAISSPIFFTALKNVAKRHQLFYCNPIEKDFVETYGIQCAAFYHLDEHGLYDIEKYIYEDEAQLKIKECAVLVFHPGYLDQYVIDHSSYTFVRPMETAFLCTEKFKQYIAENKIEIIDFHAFQ